MKLEVINPKDLNKRYRLSIHKTAKIGFPSDAAEKLKLPDNKSANFLRNISDETDTNWYLVLYNDKDSGFFKINKNGDYYSINIKVLLDDRNIDYTTGKLWFEMEEVEVEGEKVYKLSINGLKEEITDSIEESKK